MPPTHQVNPSVAAAAEVPTNATGFLVVEHPCVYQANHGAIQQAPELSQSANNENCGCQEFLAKPAKAMPYDTIGGYSTTSNNNAAQRSLSVLEDSASCPGGLAPASNLLSLDCSRMPSKCGSLAQLDAETQDLDLLSLGVSLNSPIAAAQQQQRK